MKRILFFLMFFSLHAFAIDQDRYAANSYEDSTKSSFNLDEPVPDCPLDDPACPLPEGPIPPDISYKSPITIVSPTQCM